MAAESIAARDARWEDRVAVPTINRKPGDMMRAISPTNRRSVTYAERIPITPEAFHWLEMEVDRLAAEVDDESSTAWMKSLSGDSDAPTFMVNGEFEVLVRRLQKLRAAISSSRVKIPDGSVMVGTRVTVRTDDGALESYLLVSPGASDARDASISPESPVGAALIGRLPGDTVQVRAPGGVLVLQVVSVEKVPTGAREPVEA
jgi:transcription elongation factor GreA